MKSNAGMWIVVLLVIVIGGSMLMKKSDNTVTPSMSIESTMTPSPSLTASDATTVTLIEQNELGQSGTAVLTTNAEGKLVVTLAMTGGTFANPQPAHIHVGSCPTPGAVKFPLANVVDGTSETVLDTTWAALAAGGEALAINVHKSAAESTVYTACGDLPVTSAGIMEEDAGTADY